MQDSLGLTDPKLLQDEIDKAKTTGAVDEVFKRYVIYFLVLKNALALKYKNKNKIKCKNVNVKAYRHTCTSPGVYVRNPKTQDTWDICSVREHNSSYTRFASDYANVLAVQVYHVADS